MGAASRSRVPVNAQFALGGLAASGSRLTSILFSRYLDRTFVLLDAYSWDLLDDIPCGSRCAERLASRPIRQWRLATPGNTHSRLARDGISTCRRCVFQSAKCVAGGMGNRRQLHPIRRGYNYGTYASSLAQAKHPQPGLMFACCKPHVQFQSVHAESCNRSAGCCHG